MISWIRGEVIDTWFQNHKFYVLINCQGLGYEIQILKSLKDSLNKINIDLWIEHIKREDNEIMFGFLNKDERDFFRELLRIKGIGPQIGMSLLNEHSLNEVKYSIINKEKQLLTSVPGIGNKMTERILFELSNKLNQNESEPKQSVSSPQKDDNFTSLSEDINMALSSLNYTKKDIYKALNFLAKKFKNKDLVQDNIENKLNFEQFLKISMEYIEKNT